MHCKEDSKEVNIFMSAGGGKQLERAFHFDKVVHHPSTGSITNFWWMNQRFQGLQFTATNRK